MHRLFIVIFVSIFPFFLFSQIDSFDIAGYSRPDLRRETASVVPDFSLNTRTGTEDFVTGDSTEEEATYVRNKNINKANGLSLTIGMGFWL